ncbi:MAG: class I SAM-dependent methyltransferase [Nanoarchaeota archaeon]|nr:class I SAM-dependent methyltransferase [Nanoarchaeota archaeon]
MSDFNYNATVSKIYVWCFNNSSHNKLYTDFLNQSNLDIRPGDKVLDAGCGDLFLTRLFLNEYSRHRNIHTQVSAFDKSKYMLRYAQKNAVKFNSHIKLFHANGLKIPFPDNSFDFVMTSGMLEYLTNNFSQAAHELTRVLKPGKQMLISFDRDTLMGRLSGKIWGFKPIPQKQFQKHFKEIDLQEFKVDSDSIYAQLFRRFYIGIKK